MNKEFVTYEQALALKELGFDEPCLVVWPGIEGQKLGYDGRYFSLVKGYKNSKLSKEVKKYAPGIIDVAAPLYQQVFRWFREKHNLFSEIQMDRTTEPKFCFVIFKYEHFGNYEKVEVDEWYLYRTYEEAEQVCLTKLIEITNAKIKNRR